MQFRAKLRPGSAIYKIWFGASRIGGMISGVNFKRVGTDYVSVKDPLPEEHIHTLMHHPMVDLELSTEPVGSVVVVPNEEAREVFGADSPPPMPSASPEARVVSEKEAIEALWRRDDEPKQEPVMRKRGRPPLVR